MTDAIRSALEAARTDLRDVAVFLVQAQFKWKGDDSTADALAGSVSKRIAQIDAALASLDADAKLEAARDEALSEKGQRAIDAAWERHKAAAPDVEKVARAIEDAHYANGVADLAIKHRDIAEAEVARLTKELEIQKAFAVEMARAVDELTVDNGALRAKIKALGGSQ